MAWTVEKVLAKYKKKKESFIIIKIINWRISKVSKLIIRWLGKIRNRKLTNKRAKYYSKNWIFISNNSSKRNEWETKLISTEKLAIWKTIGIRKARK